MAKPGVQGTPIRAGAPWPVPRKPDQGKGENLLKPGRLRLKEGRFPEEQIMKLLREAVRSPVDGRRPSVWELAAVQGSLASVALSAGIRQIGVKPRLCGINDRNCRISPDPENGAGHEGITPLT